MLKVGNIKESNSPWSSLIVIVPKPNFSSITRPQPDCMWWTNVAEQVFLKLKEALVNYPVLRNPDFNSPYATEQCIRNHPGGHPVPEIQR